MNNILLNGDIEEPYERQIENCSVKKDIQGVDVCLTAGAPCIRAIEGGKCEILKEYFGKKFENDFLYGSRKGGRK